MDRDIESAIRGGVSQLSGEYIGVCGYAGIIRICNTIRGGEIMGDASKECQQLCFIELRSN